MKAKKLISLNPYYTGSYSIRCNAQDVYNIALGLNPYYTGSYSISTQTHTRSERRTVLILIILEVTL